MVYTDTWNSTFEGLPQDTDNVADGADKIRDLKLAVRERMQHDHYFDPAGTDADHGEHKQVTLHAPISTPTYAANKAYIYGKDVSSKIELHFLDEDNNEIQLTSGGLLNPSLFKDEDDMASDSASYGATQQSIKAYALNQAIGTTKGDIIVFTASDTPARLGVGSNGQVIVADSGEAGGAKWSSLWTYGSQVATTSGSSVNVVTSLPSGLTDIDIIFKGVSTSAQSTLKIQIGDSGGFETSGYDSGATDSNSALIATDGFVICKTPLHTAAADESGIIRLTRWDSAEHVWIASGAVGSEGIVAAAGQKTLSAEITQVRITTSAGTFDGGEIRVRYR